MGDGFLATFDSPTRAVECARAIRNGMSGLGLEMRAGIHTGDCELVGGDVAGVAGAALWLGEIPELAVMQAVASGTAALISGFVGSEVKDILDAIRRRKEKLSEDEKQLSHLFGGPNSGDVIVKLVGGIALVVGLLIAGAVAALRSSTEGGLAGVVFGCLAGAISLASFLSSFAYADQAADLLDAAERDYKRELKASSKLSSNPVRRRYAAAVATAASIRLEFKELVLGLKASILRRNPGVAGHGWPRGVRRQPGAPPPRAERGIRRPSSGPRDLVPGPAGEGRNNGSGGDA
jgi:hypothetical protein